MAIPLSPDENYRMKISNEIFHPYPMAIPLSPDENYRMKISNEIFHPNV